jgi:hypothetical protein
MSPISPIQLSACLQYVSNISLVAIICLTMGDVGDIIEAAFGEEFLYG